MIPKAVAERALEKAMSTGADYAEIFLEDTVSNRIAMVDDQLETVTRSHAYGAGLRVLRGVQSVFASTNDLTEEGLLAVAGRIASALAQGSQTLDIVLNASFPVNLSPIEIVPADFDTGRKVELVRAGYNAAKNYSSEIRQVQSGILDKTSHVTVCTSDGKMATDHRVWTRYTVSAVASDGTENQTGFAGPGRMMGMEMFNLIDPTVFAAKAAKQAVTMLHARNCPSGKMPVAIQNGFGGVIFHEACGHSLEATSVAKGNSEFCGKLGQKIANERVTALDDGTIPNAWGSLNMDDEGNPTQRKVLIENGILKGYMIDKLGGRRMEMPATGSSRRQSYEYAPTSRMTNTYIANGSDDNEEIIRTMGDGLYAATMGGGSVNPVTGEFNFAVAEGYLVRDGKICEPVRGASLIGRGSEILLNIDRVGQNMDMGQGMCGSASGSVPTNVGQPLIRVQNITVGGRD